MKNWHYELSSFNIWSSFDNGYVKAETLQEAKEKAKEQIIYDVEKANEALSHCENTKGFSISIDIENLEVREEKVLKINYDD